VYALLVRLFSLASASALIFALDLLAKDLIFSSASSIDAVSSAKTGFLVRSRDFATFSSWCCQQLVRDRRMLPATLSAASEEVSLVTWFLLKWIGLGVSQVTIYETRSGEGVTRKAFARRRVVDAAWLLLFLRRAYALAFAGIRDRASGSFSSDVTTSVWTSRGIDSSTFSSLREYAEKLLDSLFTVNSDYPRRSSRKARQNSQGWKFNELAITAPMTLSAQFNEFSSANSPMSANNALIETRVVGEAPQFTTETSPSLRIQLHRSLICV
jgi:hypothetical protein